MNATISIVIPVYKGEFFLQELYDRLCKNLSNLVNEFEIIFVNDSSPDNSWDIIQQLVKQDDKVIGIDFSRNFGQHYAISAGLDKSQYEWVVVMDCDLQDRPEEITTLLDKALEGYDMVLARRTERQDSYLKRLSSTLFYRIFSYLTDTKQDASVGNFGIYHRKVILSIVSMKERLRFFPIMSQWVGYKSTSVDIQHDSRQHGKSSYSLKKLLDLSLDTIISYSDKPLILTVKVGFTISLLSFIYALYIIIRALLGIKGIEGWPSLITSIWLVGGILMFVSGIIGVYISKIFDETKKRPVYIIREICTHERTENT